MLEQPRRRPPDADTAPGAPRAFSVGDWVRIERFQTAGQIMRLTPHGKCEIVSGNITYRVSVNDITFSEAPQQPPHKSPACADSDFVLGPTPLVREVDLHGLRCREAERVLLAEIARARIEHSHRIVRVIHGVGSGALASQVLRIAEQAGIRVEPDARSWAATLLFFD